MIRPLPAAAEKYLALGQVNIRCENDCGIIAPLHRLPPPDEHCLGCGGNWSHVDLSTILTTDKAAEVGEMCGQSFVEIGTYVQPYTGQIEASSARVTARLFLLTGAGEPVEWKQWHDPCDHARRTCEEIGCQGPYPVLSALTAVVLVGNAFAETWKPAATACSDAGIPLIIPGDTERGRLEL